jgi:predicted extracellular nuclease
MADTIFFESFETDGNGTRYITSTPEFSDGFGDFFTRTDGSNIGSFYQVTGSDGNFFFAAQDIDGEGATSQQTLLFSSIDISGFSSLNFSALFAEDDDGSNQDWDLPDFVRVEYQIDGGGFQNLLAIENDGDTFNSAPFIDTDFDGIGDGTEITSTFTEFGSAIVGTGLSLDLRFTFDLNAGDEDIAIDNIQITGDAVAPTTPLISEFQPNPTGTDPANVTFELSGTPGEAFSGVIVSIESDSGSSAGIVDRVASVSGTFDANGLLTVDIPDLENPSFTVALLSEFTGDTDTDIDTDNDGIADDLSTFGTVFDAIGIPDNSGDEAFLYGTDLGGADFTFTGDEPRLVFRDGGTGDWYAINDPDGGQVFDVNGTDVTPAIFDTDPTIGTDTFGTINPSVGDGNPVPDPDPEPTITKIHAIQGNASTQQAGGEHDDRSPLDGQSVTIQGVVIAVFPELNGFFIQEEDADADSDAATSEGIFIFTGSTPSISEGNIVTVTGAVDEFFGMTQIDNDNGDFSVTIADPGNNLNLVSPGIIDIPATGDIDDFYEQSEGMLVQFSDKLFVSEYFELARYGQIVLTEGSRPYQYTHVDETPTAAEFQAFETDLARRQIILDDGNNDQNAPLPDGTLFHPQPNGFGVGTQGQDFFRGGDSIESLTGVLHWSWAGFSGTDAWRIRPTEANPVEFTVENPRPAAPEDVGGNIQVASFNVLNYFTTLDEGSNTSINGDPRGANSDDELQRQTTKLVEALKQMDADVIALSELENNGDVALNALVDALNAEVGAGTYAGISTGVAGTDVITAGIIYKLGVVAPQGSVAVLDDPAFLDPNSTGEQRNRPAIAQSFKVINPSNPDFGESFSVISNHFKSKGFSGATGIDADQGDGQGNWNDTRTQAAEYLVNVWIPQLISQGFDEDFLITGDLNAYRFEDPITALKNAGYTDLIKEFQGDNAYSFVFDSKLGYLDHALSSASLTPQVTGVTEWHVNADEANVFDYNNTIQDGNERSFEAKPSGNVLFEPNAFRNSDHDPLIVGLDLETLNTDPIAEDDTATLDLDKGETTPKINVLANDSDADGDTLTIASFDDSATSGLVIQNADDTFTYDANGYFAYLDAGETATDNFSYTISDGELTDTATVTVTIDGPADVTNSGTSFSFSQGTNGGANRFGFDGDSFFISGQGVSGRPKFDDFDDFLKKAAEVFDGVIERSGTINDQRLPSGDGPNNITVNDNDEVIIGGRSTSGNYKIQFDNTSEADTFKTFAESMFDEINANNAVATDPEDFRFDVLTGTRLFFDDVNDQFGFTNDAGVTQTRFDELELFVEAVAIDLFGGTQLRDGRFNDQRIADGRIPNRIRVYGDDVIITGQSVGGRFQFDFDDTATAQAFADTARELFGNIAESGALASI